MKIVAGWLMEGSKPSVPKWDGTGRHPILGMTMDQIKHHAKASTVRYTPPADSDEKAAKMTPEQEQAHMEILARERQQRFIEALSESLSHR